MSNAVWQFNADGTYESSFDALGGKVKMTEHGTYTLDGNSLRFHHKESTDSRGEHSTKQYTQSVGLRWVSGDTLEVTPPDSTRSIALKRQF